MIISDHRLTYRHLRDPKYIRMQFFESTGIRNSEDLYRITRLYSSTEYRIEVKVLRSKSTIRL